MSLEQNKPQIFIVFSQEARTAEGSNIAGTNTLLDGTVPQYVFVAEVYEVPDRIKQLLEEAPPHPSEQDPTRTLLERIAADDDLHDTNPFLTGIRALVPFFKENNGVVSMDEIIAGTDLNAEAVHALSTKGIVEVRIDGVTQIEIVTSPPFQTESDYQE